MVSNIQIELEFHFYHAVTDIYLPYVLRESFEGGLIDPQDDVTHIDATALCRWLAGKQFFNPHHAGAGGLVRDILLSTETEAQS